MRKYNSPWSHKLMIVLLLLPFYCNILFKLIFQRSDRSSKPFKQITFDLITKLTFEKIYKIYFVAATVKKTPFSIVRSSDRYEYTKFQCTDDGDQLFNE